MNIELQFTIEIPESLKKYSKEKLSEIFEYLEHKYDVESYINKNQLVINSPSLE